MRHTLTSTALALLLALPAGAAQAAPVTFDFLFAPDAGTGTMTFDDPGDGTHDFFGLTNVSALFDVGTLSFTLADLDTTSGALAIIETQGSTRTLVFSGSGDGPIGGSLDFSRDATALSFGPSGFEGLYYVLPGGDILRYSATAPAAAAIPLPAGLPLLATGLAVLGLLRRRASA